MNKSSTFEKGVNPLSSSNTRAESPYFVVEKHESDGNNTLVSDLTSCTGALKVCNEKTSGKTQLGLQQVELYGRSVEVGVLREAFKRISNKESEPGSSEVVRVFGAGGSGKSYLVEKALRNFTATAHTGFFVSGKYDQQTQHELYSAIIVALTDLCDLILQSIFFEEIKASITKGLGTDAAFLSRLIPALTHITGTEREYHEIQPENMGRAFVRFKIVVRNFVRSAATAKHPICLFLDDMQWADGASLEIINALVTDSLSKHVLIVLAYRDDDVETRPMLDALFVKKSNKLHLRTFSIRVAFFNLESLNIMLSELLQIDTATVLSLSSLILRKTHGNAYFVFKFLESLQTDRLLFYSNESFRWEWNHDRIQAETNVSENVVSLITSRIRKMNDHVQAVLKLAACFGHRFNVNLLASTLYTIHVKSIRLKAARHGSDPSSEVSSEEAYWKRTIKILDIAAEEGMIEENSETHWKFSHDRVQEGLYSMLKDTEKENLHMWIGFVVWKQLQSKTTIPDSSETFFAVDHLNRGINQIMKLDDRKHLDISALNLDAARLAMEKGAFSRAAEYVRIGMKLLEESRNKWEHHYDLTMALHAIGAEVEYCAGNYENCNQAATEVLQHAKFFDEKLVVYYTMINALGAQGRFMDAMDLGFSILREMGVKFPKNPGKAQVVLEVRRTHRAIKGRTDEQLLALPLCDDKDIFAAIKLLSTMASIAYLKATEPIIFCLLGLRMMRLSCTHGLNKWSCHGFACFAAVQSVLGHRDVAYRFGGLALELLEKLGAKETECRVLVVLNHLVLHWRLPLENAVEGFMRSYKHGLEYGDIGMAFIAAAGVLTTSYYCPSHKLPDIEAIASTFCEQMFQFNEESVLRVGLPFWQLILNLRGNSEEPWKLAGEAMQRLELLSPVVESDNKMGRHVEQSIRLTLALYFEKWDEASLALKDLIAIPGHYTNYLYASTMSLAAFELYRLTGKRRYHKIIKSTMKKLEAWEQEGVKNVRFRLLLLRAEKVSLTFNVPTAKAAYDLAISASVENCDPHYEAMASERAANYFLRKGNQDLAQQYIIRSREKYREWGAPGKDQFLREKYTWLFRQNDPSSNFLLQE